MVDKFPVCPDCGKRHAPDEHAAPTIDKAVGEKIMKRVNRLMQILRDQDPELVLRLLISMLASVAGRGNVQTRQNVARVLGKRLDLTVLFGVPPVSDTALQEWKPKGPADTSEVN